MKICILGLGVIGTTYGYALQKAGHQVEHWIREHKRASAPARLSVEILDGRYNKKGEEKKDNYEILLAEKNTDYDLIIMSVASGAVQNAMETITANHLNGSVLLFCNFWNSRAEIQTIFDTRPFVIGFPTAGGHMGHDTLNCVLFDHIMLESNEKTNIPNYPDLLALLQSAGLKAEIPYDMTEWIWLHMAINAGVTSTAAQNGNVDDPRQLALNLMGDSRMIKEAIRTIRETIKAVSARGVDLKKYRGEVMPYRLPAPISSVVMKRMFANNELTSRIMTLHNDIKDILYGCSCVYQTAKEEHLDLPRYYDKMDRILQAVDEK